MRTNLPRAMIATDYDGTLRHERGISTTDREAILQWQARGHLFGVATGRDMPSIREELEEAQIPCDFWICLNGAELYGGNCALLCEHTIVHPLMEPLLPVLCRGADLATAHRGDSMCLLSQKGSPLVPCSLGHVSQYSFWYATEAEAASRAAAVARDMRDFAVPLVNGQWINVVAAGVDKREGVETMRGRLGIDADRVITFGDNHNDRDMLIAFEGYAIAGSPIAGDPSIARRCASLAEVILAKL